MLDLYVFTFHNEGRVYRALSLLSPEEVHANGLPTEAVLGEISALLPSMTPEQFEPNAAFLALLHELVEQQAPTLTPLQAEAQTLGSGYVAVVDERVQGGAASIASEDIIGRFEVSRGEIKPASYIPNEHYRLLSDKGPIQLPLSLESALQAAVRAKLAAQN